MKVVIDRIEGTFAVLEVDGESVDWPLKSLPAGIREGDVFEWNFERVSPVEDAEEQLNRLRESSPKGDLIEL